MITPSFGLTATERVLPKLALDFTTASLDSRITFTRTTGASNPATYVGSNGFITSATNNQPRFDYDPVTLACKGLLIEESRSNIILYSEQFDNAAWSKSNSTVTADAVTSPSNTTSADTLTTTSTINCLVGQTVSSVPTTAHTLSIYVKKGTTDFCYFREYISIGSLRVTYFNIASGTVGTVSTGHTATINNAGNGWYRCSITFTPDAVRTQVAQFGICTNNGSTAVAVGATGYVWGAQLEAGAFATSYIPTTTTALTRNADVATMTGTNFSDWFNASEGATVVWADFLQGGSPSGDNFMFNINSSSDVSGKRLSLLRSSSTEQGGRAVIVNTSVQVNILSGTSLTANTQYKFAYGYKLNNYAFYRGSTQLGTDTSCTIPTVDQAFIGCSSATVGFANGHIAKLFYYPQRLLNAELAAVSK